MLALRALAMLLCMASGFLIGRLLASGQMDLPPLLSQIGGLLAVAILSLLVFVELGGRE